MEFEEYKNRHVKHKGQKHKVENSWGVYDAYKLIRKHGWYKIGRPVKEHEFYTIIRQINQLLAKELIKGNGLKLPANMGVLELKKFERYAGIVNGKLKIKYPVDWNSTWKLWYEDEEAYRNKSVVRFEDKYHYYIRYDKHQAKYENKVFYAFQPNSNIKKELKTSIKQGNTDTLW